MPKIRKANIKDIPTLVGFRVKLRNHIEDSNRLSLKFKQELIPRLSGFYKTSIGDSDSLVLIAESNGEPIGMAVGNIKYHTDFNPERSVNINDIWVEESHRKKGVCTKLFKYIVKHFKKKDIKLFTVSFDNGNTEAETAWSQLGFKPITYNYGKYI